MVTTSSDGLDFNREIELMRMRPPDDREAEAGWLKIAGNEAAKDLIYLALVLAPKIPRVFPLTNILLFGPGGTGKTLMVKGAARSTGLAVYNVPCDSISQKYQGESEK